MFAFKCHHTYINDCRWARQLCAVDEVEAYELLRRSPYVKRDDPDTQGTMLNKGFCLVEVRDGCAILVYNHDGRYYLYTAPAAEALAALNLPPLDAESTPAHGT